MQVPAGGTAKRQAAIVVVSSLVMSRRHQASFNQADFTSLHRTAPGDTGALPKKPSASPEEQQQGGPSGSRDDTSSDDPNSASSDNRIIERPSLRPLATRRAKIEYFTKKGFRKEWTTAGLSNWVFYVIGGFLGTTLYLEVFVTPYESAIKVPDLPMTEFEKERAEKQNDPNRVPWPLLHLHVTEIREGKRSHDELQKLWDQTKFYYPGDWLIPVELTQVIKYTSPKFLSQYVADPDLLRKEMLFQLLQVKYAKVKTIDRMTKETKELINVAVDELSAMNLSNTDEIPLVPTHSK